MRVAVTGGTGFLGAHSVAALVHRVLLGLGRVSDLAARVLPTAPLLSYEAAWLLTSRTPTDDSRTHDELGVQWRPTAETVSAAVRRPG